MPESAHTFFRNRDTGFFKQGFGLILLAFFAERHGLFQNRLLLVRKIELFHEGVAAMSKRVHRQPGFFENLAGLLMERLRLLNRFFLRIG